MTDVQQFHAWREEIQEQLHAHSKRWAAIGLPMVAAEGKLLRPMVAYCTAHAIEPSLLKKDIFWDAVLAVQMVHEASLVHDDIIDEAETRRGKPTVVSRKGVSAALVLGDHLLTSAYRLVAKAGSPTLMTRFTEAVEQTVAGEIEQAKTIGRSISLYDYSSMIAKKSGALFAFSMSIAPILAEDARAKALWLCGLRLGCQYQRLDDLLDYCSHADVGKPPLQDYYQQKPTWPWIYDPKQSWERPLEEMKESHFASSSAEESFARKLYRHFAEYGSVLRDDLSGHLGDMSEPLETILLRWEQKADEAIAREERCLSDQEESEALPLSQDIIPVTTTPITLEKNPEASAAERQVAIVHATATIKRDAARLRELLGEEGLLEPSHWQAYFQENSRSFSFAARWFPPSQRRQIAGVYAYCRCSDELADGFGDLATNERLGLIAQWRQLTSAAYEGKSTDMAILDRVIGDMAAAEVPLRYPLDLLEGMCMDLRGDEYPDLPSLLHYCYCVASTVGLWLTELFGKRDPWILSRADALGKAMQLTNILRDVGEDLERDRIYLPQERMQAFGIEPSTLLAMKQRTLPILGNYRAMIEELMAISEHLYDGAFEAIPSLPGFFRRPVAVAATVYRGIHREIRNNGYDNLSRRAYTSTWRKLFLALVGLRRLWRTSNKQIQRELLTLDAFPGAHGGKIPKLLAHHNISKAG